LHHSEFSVLEKIGHFVTLSDGFLFRFCKFKIIINVDVLHQSLRGGWILGTEIRSSSTRRCCSACWTELASFTRRCCSACWSTWT
jgi:hypothetical protein